MASKEDKDLVVKEENMFAIPEGDVMEGLENIDGGMLTIPRLKLVQATSPEVTNDEYRDFNLRAGDVIDSISKEKVEGTFIPVQILPSTNVLFVPRTAEGKAQLKAVKSDITDEDLAQQGSMICTARDGKIGDRYGACSKCGLCNFKGNTKPMCQKAINVLVLLESGNVAMISFRDTSYKHGRNFVNILYQAAQRGERIQTGKYKLSPTKKTMGDKQWYELAITRAGNAEQEQAYNAYQTYINLKDTMIVSDTEDEGVVDTTPTNEFI